MVERFYIWHGLGPVYEVSSAWLDANTRTISEIHMEMGSIWPHYISFEIQDLPIPCDFIKLHFQKFSVHFGEEL